MGYTHKALENMSVFRYGSFELPSHMLDSRFQCTIQDLSKIGARLGPKEKGLCDIQNYRIWSKTDLSRSYVQSS